jgi:hypothetical protein
MCIHIYVVGRGDEQLMVWPRVVELLIRVARWHIFKPKILIWVNFGGSCNGRCWYILWPFGIFYALLSIICGRSVYFYGYLVNFSRFGTYVVQRKIWQPCFWYLPPTCCDKICSSIWSKFSADLRSTYTGLSEMKMAAGDIYYTMLRTKL